jgi:RNA polymerase sigma-70 factor (ECF subfamily)
MSRIATGAGDAPQRPDAGPGAADRQLCARLVAGEADALAAAYRQYAGLVFGVCRRVLNDPALAEDVTQEVFAYLWQSPERFDAACGSLRSWLGLLAHRRSVDRVRAESRRVKGETRCEPSASVDPDMDDYLAATWLAGRVRDALAQLPDEQRQALVLAYYGDNSYRQVAVQLAVPEGTVKSRVRLGLRKLDDLLRADYTDMDAAAWT